MAKEFMTPRRNDVNQQTLPEQQITAAISTVESLDAHPKLTEASVLLQKARDLVADYVDEDKKPDKVKAS